MGAAFPAELQPPRTPRARAPLDVIAVVAAGGAIGSVLRYAMWLRWPGPWSTLVINVVGCAAMGILMYVITEVVVAHRLVRPFLGVGILGGFTTFSTYVSDALRLVLDHQPALALIYLVATVFTCMLAVLTGSWLTRLTTRAFRRGAH